ncbi:MAG: hypothetical protein OHK0048_23620 [Rhodoferax sp.]
MSGRPTRPLQDLLRQLARARADKLAQWSSLGLTPAQPTAARATDEVAAPTGAASRPEASALDSAPADMGPILHSAGAYFRATWAEMETAQRLRQARQHLPVRAGPYNPQRLLVQALSELHRLSPAVARAWVAWIDTLWALPAPTAAFQAPRRIRSNPPPAAPQSGAGRARRGSKTQSKAGRAVARAGAGPK